MEGGLPCKFLIPGDFFAESRQQRSYGSQTAALAYCNGSEVIMLQEAEIACRRGRRKLRDFRSPRSQSHQRKWNWRCVNAAQKTGLVRFASSMFEMRSERCWRQPSRRTSRSPRTASRRILQACTRCSSSPSIPKRTAWSITQQWVVAGSSIHTNTIESSFSLLKRGLIGSSLRVTIEHLHRNLSE